MEKQNNCLNKDVCLEGLTDEIFKEIFSKIDENLKDVTVPADQWKLYYRIEIVLLRFPRDQPNHVEDQEAKRIVELREHHNYSFDDLAFIFNRSKSTIAAVLKLEGPFNQS